MIRIGTILAAGVVVAALAGCDAQVAAVDAASPAPSVAEQACLREVTGVTANPDVVLLESRVSEAGTETIVGVGEQRALWRCVGYGDGTTAEIMSLTDEGAL